MNVLSPAQLKRRIAGRVLAEELIKLASDENSDIEHLAGFARHMRRFADRALGAAETELRVLNDADARAFENTVIGFGSHYGSKIKDVPIEYLTWVSDQSHNLSAYLRSDIGRKRIEQNV